MGRHIKLFLPVNTVVGRTDSQQNTRVEEDAREKSACIRWHVTCPCFLSGGQTPAEREQEYLVKAVQVAEKGVGALIASLEVGNFLLQTDK